METAMHNTAGGYRFIPGIPAFSEGAVALPGFSITHARFDRFVPLDTAYALVENELKEVGRPMHALCGMELRIPKPFTIPEFRSLNGGYIGVLRDSGRSSSTV
jgi:hypothetical protein